MPYFITLPDHPRFDVEDLPLTRWAAIQKATGVGWVEALSNGTLVSNAAVAVAVVHEVAEMLGTQPPVLTVKELADVFSFEAKENNPTGFVEGIPDPKAKGSEPETT